MIASLAETIRSRPFPAMVELVASGRREAQVLEIASNLATVPEIIAGSITSYGTGRAGDDPIRGAATVRARGLTPNVHFTCGNRDRAQAGKDLHILRALELFNVFALTGDPPGRQAPAFDSVQLTAMIAAMRADQQVPFHITVAVSPFGHTGDALKREYERLDQKIAGGADLVITQAGSDANQFAELKQQLDTRGVTTPVLANVHAPAEHAADATEINAVLARAAKLVAALRSLGYTGVYFSGTSEADHIRQILDQSKTS